MCGAMKRKETRLFCFIAKAIKRVQFDAGYKVISVSAYSKRAMIVMKVSRMLREIDSAYNVS